MPLPRINELFLPFLEFLDDEKSHTIGEITQHLAERMELTESERKEVFSSGKLKFSNSVLWTRTYLAKAGLINGIKRGVLAITDEGKRVLKSNPSSIDEKFLMQYEGFRQFKMPTEGKETEIPVISDATPQDEIEDAFKKINNALVSDLLSEIMHQTPEFFEGLVVRLLVKMGYGGSIKDAGRVLGRSGDEGIDGVVQEDKLGFNKIYIQAKRWELNRPVGRPDIHAFMGALAGKGAAKGLFITTSSFSKEAEAYTNQPHVTKIVLVDGKKLANLMVEHNLGVSTDITYELKKIDTDFFDPEGE